MTTKSEALVTKTEALDYLHRIRTDPSAWVPSLDAVQDLASTVVALHDDRRRLMADAERQAEEAHEHETWVDELSAVARDDETLEETLGRCIDALSEAGDLAVDLDAARLEIRRLRAAEAPGTDDEALEGTGWRWLMGEWQHQEDPPVWSHNGVWLTRIAGQIVRFSVAIDAMRAAVPGSV